MKGLLNLIGGPKVKLQCRVGGYVLVSFTWSGLKVILRFCYLFHNHNTQVMHNSVEFKIRLIKEF